MKFIIADTETNGLEAPIKVCEIGLIEIDSDLEILSEFDSLVNPEADIHPEASGVHGIRAEQVENEPTIDELTFPEGDICLICHNVKFDRPLLEPHINVVAQCDTLILARRMLPDSPDHKLATLSAYCDLPQALAHRALGDCRTVLYLLDYLMEGSGWSLTQLINYSNEPQKVSKMPWGKWVGTPMDAVPSGYLRWLRSLDDLDIDMKFTIDNL